MKVKIFLFALVVLAKTSFAQKDSSTIDISTIYKCWTNSREEQKEGSLVRIYRPCDYKVFPASRFRDRFEFKENGECSWLYLSPDDGHFMVQGSWTYDKENALIVIKDRSNKIKYELKLISITKDLMRLEQSNR